MVNNNFIHIKCTDEDKSKVREAAEHLRISYTSLARMAVMEKVRTILNEQQESPSASVDRPLRRRLKFKVQNGKRNRE